MSGDLSVAEVLERAADLIEPEGAWFQGYYASRHPKYDDQLSPNDPAARCWCMEGAIMKIVGPSGYGHPAFDQLSATLPEMDDHKGRIVGFNDAPGRTQAEVVAALRRAATIAKGGEHVG